MSSSPLIGVLALQGGFEAHGRMLRGLGARVREVRAPGDLDGLEGLVIPGGESTTMTLGIQREGLAEPLRELVRGGGVGGIAVLGSCAGLIMLDREHLGLMDIRAERNAFGRQLQSFEADIELRRIDSPPPRGNPMQGGLLRKEPVDGGALREEAAQGGLLSEESVGGGALRRELAGGGALRGEPVQRGPIRAVFIRAPWIAEHGPGVEVLAVLDGHPVAARQGNMLAVAFHAELTDDDRVHRLFLSAV